MYIDLLCTKIKLKLNDKGDICLKVGGNRGKWGGCLGGGIEIASRTKRDERGKTKVSLYRELRICGG